MKTRIAFGLSLFLLICSRPVFAQDQTAVDTQNIFSRLQNYPELRVVIETDLKKLRQEKAETTWQPAVFKVMDGKKVAFQQPVTVAARGNMRRKTCDFPPLKIRFYAEKPEDDSLADINELKLVVSCRNSETDDQLVMRECFAYSLFNLFTDASFRVKAAKLEVKNPGKKRSILSGAAFFIESEKEMATRLGGRPLKPRIISPKIMDSTAYVRMSLFQYMIGNTDWGAYTRHNIKIVGIPDRPPLAVPYDFDYSGLVNADYAVPSPDIPIPTVQHRYYLGLTQSAETYQKAFDEFAARKAAVFARCEQFPGLSAESRLYMKDYLNSFYAILEDPRKVQKSILENCDKRIKN